MKQPTSTGSNRTARRGRNSQRKNKTPSNANSTHSEDKNAQESSGDEVDNKIEKAVIDKLEQMIQEALENHSVVFTKEEALALKSVAARERAWQSIGLLANMAKSVLTYVGFFLAAWISFKAGLIEWLAKELGR